jgi:hypothetical protein
MKPVIQISEHYYAFEADFNKPKAERYALRQGNWSDAGWHWSGGYDRLFLFLSRFTQGGEDNPTNSFLEKIEKNPAWSATQPLILKDAMLSLIQDDENMWGITGDNNLWEFGQYENNDEYREFENDVKNLIDSIVNKTKISEEGYVYRYKPQLLKAGARKLPADKLAEILNPDDIYTYIKGMNFEDFVKRTVIQKYKKEIIESFKGCYTLREFFSRLKPDEDYTIIEELDNYNRELFYDAVSLVIERWLSEIESEL